MNRIVAFALKQQALMAALFVFVCVAGLVSFMRLNIEAYPDPVPPLVDIVAQNAGQSAEEMERYVTIPLEIQMAGIPHVSAIRTISLFGLSDVKLQFTYDVTYEEAEQMAIDQLAQLSSLPSGVKPQISPWSPIGEIFRYRVVGPQGLFGDRPQDDRGLAARTALQGGARRRGRERLGRQEQDLRRERRSKAAERCGIDPGASHPGSQQQQFERRRTDPEFRPARRGRTRGRAHPIHGRHSQHDRVDVGRSRHPSCAMSPTSRRASRRASASPARTTTTTSCRALC